MTLAASISVLGGTPLRQLLNYDQTTGVLTWRTGMNRGLAGKRAGCLHKPSGYRQVWLGGKRLMEHRLIWLWMTGNEVKYQIDHINRVRDDNRWANLRQATASENMLNREPRPGASGVIGVSWSSVKNRWLARKYIDGRRVHIGFFKSIDDASAALSASFA